MTRFIQGTKRYVVIGVDTETRVAFAACYTNHGSHSAGDFLRRARQVIPDCPDFIQTDNGSEFALHFESACKELGLVHFHTYLRSPQMNAYVGRLNRTLDEEFLSWNASLMEDDVSRFNQTLINWLLWYNGERPYLALGQQELFRYILERVNSSDCYMWWTHTIS